MPDPTMTLAEAARGLAGVSPYLPPQMAEVVTQVVQAALQVQAERESVQGQLAAERQELASVRAAREAESQRLQDFRSSVAEVKAQVHREEETLRHVKEALAVHTARLEKADKLRSTFFDYVEVLRG